MFGKELFNKARKTVNRENESKKRKVEQEESLRGQGIKQTGNLFNRPKKGALVRVCDIQIPIEMPSVFDNQSLYFSFMFMNL